jgi:hypothetical protein
MHSTVVWHPAARELLAEIWLQARDRAEVSRAANSLDRSLKNNPAENGQHEYDRVYRILYAPLEVFYEVLPEDRIVKVAYIRRFDWPSTGGNGKH